MISPELFSALSNRSLLDQRFATSLSGQTIPMLNEAARYIRDRLAREGNTIASRKRLNKLLSDIEKRLSKIYSDIDKMFMDEFKGLAIDEGKFTAAATGSVIDGNILMETPSNQALWSAVTGNPLLLNKANEYIDFAMYVKSLGEYTDKVARSISGGYAMGQTLQEMVQTIIGTRANNYQDGLIDASRRLAEQIVRTSVTHIATHARDAVFRANPDIIYGYRIIAVLDTRTSEVCRFYDQQKFSYKDKFNPKPPFHPNCRSGIIAEIYSDKVTDTDATRAANFKARKDAGKGTVGQVSAQTQYYELLKRQPKSQQDLVLGKARGLIFRNSGLSAQEFRKAIADSMGRPLTLKEMAAENKKILKYMESNSFLSGYLD